MVLRAMKLHANNEQDERRDALEGSLVDRLELDSDRWLDDHDNAMRDEAEEATS
jgi:hypothetical protein